MDWVMESFPDWSFGANKSPTSRGCRTSVMGKLTGTDDGVHCWVCPVFFFSLRQTVFTVYKSKNFQTLDDPLFTNTNKFKVHEKMLVYCHMYACNTVIHMRCGIRRERVSYDMACYFFYIFVVYLYKSVSGNIQSKYDEILGLKFKSYLSD